MSACKQEFVSKHWLPPPLTLPFIFLHNLGFDRTDDNVSRSLAPTPQAMPADSHANPAPTSQSLTHSPGPQPRQLRFDAGAARPRACCMRATAWLLALLPTGVARHFGAFGLAFSTAQPIVALAAFVRAVTSRDLVVSQPDQGAGRGVGDQRDASKALRHSTGSSTGLKRGGAEGETLASNQAVNIEYRAMRSLLKQCEPVTLAGSGATSTLSLNKKAGRGNEDKSRLAPEVERLARCVEAMRDVVDGIATSLEDLIKAQDHNGASSVDGDTPKSHGERQE